MTQYYIVWNADRSEGFITDTATDANTAKTGKHVGIAASALAERFYELYDDDAPKLTVQPVIIHKPLSKNAEKLLKRIREGAWYKAHGNTPPPVAMQELINHGLVFITGSVEVISSRYVANGHTPFLMDRAPGAPRNPDID